MFTVSNKTAVQIIYLNLAAALLVLGLAVTGVLRRAHSFDAMIIQQSRERGLDPRLTAAVIWRESRFEPAAIGAAGEIGLMQVMHGAALDWAQAEKIPDFEFSLVQDPATNIQAGTWYLARAIELWSEKEDPLPYALAQYNAGRKRALRWDKASGGDEDRFMQVIDIATTRKYVEDILARYRGE